MLSKGKTNGGKDMEESVYKTDASKKETRQKIVNTTKNYTLVRTSNIKYKLSGWVGWK